MKVVFYGKDLKKDFLLPERKDISFQMLGQDRVLPAGTDLLVTVGGDGTFLEALEIVKDSGVPVAGVNFGRMGFLTGCGPDFIGYLFDAVLNKQFSTTSHTVLTIEREDLQKRIYPYAINEICIQRLSPAMIEVDVKINGSQISTYRGDGIIVATPTGSTAYSLSVGGPIVFPGSGVLILSPIAPHNLNVRPIVFPDNAILAIQVRSRTPNAQLHLDNRSEIVDLPYSFVVKKARFSITSLTFEGNDFVTTLREKLMMGFDKREMEVKIMGKHIEKLPDHVCIIMDGNGRWALSRGLERNIGHSKGLEAVRAATEFAADKGIPYLSLFAFSEENWGRPKSETDAIMSVIMNAIHSETPRMMKNNIRCVFIGDRDQLDNKALRRMDACMKKTAGNTGTTLIVAVNYSGKWDILQAVKRLLEQNPPAEQLLTPEVFSSYLATAGVPEPDLMIRTSGEMRISNFMLWQMAYTELYFTPVLWPDFRKPDFEEALNAYYNRKRRFGKIQEFI